MLRSDHSDLTTIVLGSSHGDFGFNPAYFPGSFNLCCASQDLKHSYLLYRHVVENYKRITNVVLFYSVFSPGWNLQRNPSEKCVGMALDELFNLNIPHDYEELQGEFLKIRGRLNHLNFDSNGYRGFLQDRGKTYFPLSYGASKRAADHLRWNSSHGENLHLLRLLLCARQHNHQVSIVVPPARSDYKDALNKGFGLLFSSLQEILYEFHIDFEVKLVNAFDSQIFEDAHFGDFDHLLPTGNGTERLTRLIWEACRNPLVDEAAGNTIG